jgi:hypothetical protein
MPMLLQDSRCTGIDKKLRASDAFDWKSTEMGNLQLDLWHNHKESIGGGEDDGDVGEPISLLKRTFKPIDRAVNSFLEVWLGA